MGKRLIITEEEKTHISNLYGLLSENFIKNIVNKIANSSLYKTVMKSWDPNPQVFVQNMIKEIPGLKTVEKQFLNKVQELNSLSPDEKEKVINQNREKIEKEVPKVDSSQVNEQIGLYFTIAVIAALIYILAGIASKENPKKRDERLAKEKEEQDKINQQKKDEERVKLENERAQYKPINDLLQSNFLNKTLNLYEDSSQQIMNDNYSPIKITSIEFRQVSPSLKGIVIKGQREGAQNRTIEDIFGGKLVAVCKYNPDEFSNQMGVFDFLGKNQKQFYNKSFTDKLNQIGKQWCEKPKADFGLKQTKDDIISRTV